jgi:hypothetical protein
MLVKNVIINIDYVNDFHLDFFIKKKTNWTPIWNMDGIMMLKIENLNFFDKFSCHSSLFSNQNHFKL